METIRPIHLALLTASTSPIGYIDGRTRIHKLIYLEQQMLKRGDVSFRPYYYGPFSDELAVGLSEAVSLGLLREQVIFGIDSPNVTNYVYELSPQGEQFRNEIVSKIDGFQVVEESLKDIHEATKHLTVTEISYIAKALFILKNKDEKKAWTLSRIIKEAEKFKWKINHKKLCSIMSILIDLGLVKNN